MPYVDNNGINIHYEVEGEGEPLVMVHGTFGSWKSWRNNGFLDALKKDYRLIMVDVRGFGLSDKPHIPEMYNEDLLAADIVAILDDLGITKAHYHGYSMGGWIGFATAKYAPERFHTFILGGWQPYADKPDHSPNFASELKNISMAQLVAQWELDQPYTAEQKADALANDIDAVIAMNLNGRSDFSDNLPNMTMPCLVYCGDADLRFEGTQACVQVMPDATFAAIKGCDHGGTLSAGSAEVIQHIKTFLEAFAEA